MCGSSSMWNWLVSHMAVNPYHFWVSVRGIITTISRLYQQLEHPHLDNEVYIYSSMSSSSNELSYLVHMNVYMTLYMLSHVFVMCCICISSIMISIFVNQHSNPGPLCYLCDNEKDAKLWFALIVNTILINWWRKRYWCMYEVLSQWYHALSGNGENITE